MEIGAPFIKEVLKERVSLYGEIRTGKITEEEAESIVEGAEKFVARIKDAMNGIQKKLDEE